MIQRETINNIQMLRAIAALLVLLHHALPHYKAMGETLWIIDVISHWGFVGVDIFFVISGYIMAYTTFSKKRNLGNASRFIKHRLYRIYLGYWPFFLVALILLLLTNPDKLVSLDSFGSLFLLNTDMFQLVLPVSWSLSYELYFYIIFFFTFFISREQLYIVIPILYIILVVIVVSIYMNPELTNSFFYSPFLLEFFAGVLLYMYQKHLMKLWILPFSIVVILAAYYYGITYEIKKGLLRVLSFGMASVFVILTVLILEVQGVYSAGKKIVLLGNASYTLYLSHLIIIDLFYFSGLRGFFTHDGYSYPLLGLVGMMLLTILFSILYYQKVEQKIYHKAINY
jgi:peptidoglycan/LPS O-acetylase OafA/YrhL